MIMSTTHLVRESVRAVPTLRFRRTFMTVESLVALGGLVGTGMLLTGTNTPPVGTIEPLGLSSWVLPGGWLFATTVIPSVAATVLAWRGSPHTPTAVLVASATLAIELLVQIPFLGPSPFQAVFGGIAVTMAGLALLARRAAGWAAKSGTQ